MVTLLNIVPNFIAVGPEKTGTTKLYSLFKDNPQVSLPPFKEIRYWNEGNLIPRHSLKNVLTSSHWHYKSLRKNLIIKLLTSIRNFIFFKDASISTLLWHFRYSFGHRSNTWYSNLFSQDGTVTGDISPLYYHIPEKKIKECCKFNPDVKIIIFIRDPIDRAWSKARMNLLKHKKKRTVDFNLSEFQAFSKNIYKEWIPYIESIHLWQSYFPKVHIAIYDELLNNPIEWYQKICKFLGIEYINHNNLKQKVNKGLEFDMPKECEKILFQQYGKELLQVGQRYNLPNWLKKYEQLEADWK